MQPVPFSQIQSTPSKQPLQAVTGVITAAYKREHKTSQYGPYTVQNVTLAEPGGATIRLAIFDADELTPNHINHTFTATLGQNHKGQWVGLAADHYQNKQGQMIFGAKCTKGGKLYLDNQPFSEGGPQPATPPPQQQFAQTQPPYGQPPPQSFTPPPQSFTPPPQAFSPPPVEPKSPFAFLAGQSAAYAMCFEAALKVREQVLVQLESGPGEPLSTSDIKDIATTFYIEGNKNGIFKHVVGNFAEPEPDQP